MEGRINYRKQVLIGEHVLMTCPVCQLVYDEKAFYCSKCGTKLLKKHSKMYANYGKKGLNSITYKTADGITVNSKGTTTIPLFNGISYTVTSKKR